jgi:TRAP-type C4-dicarboxylate transport system permease large subunit
MKNLRQRLSDLAGLLLAFALLALLASSLFHHAQALLWMPAFLRTVNISLLHQFAADALIAMSMLVAARAAWLPMPRSLLICGLVLSSLLLIGGLWQGSLSLAQGENLRNVFWVIPLSAAIMLWGFLHQIRHADSSAQNYFPLDMQSGGIKIAIVFGATTFVCAIFKLGAEWTLATRYFFDSLDQFTLMAVPFLVLASVMMNPARRSGNVVPFAMLALWLAIMIGVSPGRFFFSLMVPAAMVVGGLWWAGAKNTLYWKHHARGQWFMYVAESTLFIGTMLASYVSLAEGAALAAVAVFAARCWVDGRANKQAPAEFFSISAVQSGSWLFSGAVFVLSIRLLGDLTWLANSAANMAWLKTQPEIFLLALSLPAAALCYFIGPIAMTILAASIFIPIAVAISISPVQLGVVLLFSVALVKALRQLPESKQSDNANFKPRRAFISIFIVLILVAWIPKLSLRLPLYIFGGGG